MNIDTAIALLEHEAFRCRLEDDTRDAVDTVLARLRRVNADLKLVEQVRDADVERLTAELDASETELRICRESQKEAIADGERLTAALAAIANDIGDPRDQKLRAQAALREGDCWKSKLHGAECKWWQWDHTYSWHETDCTCRKAQALREEGEKL